MAGVRDWFRSHNSSNRLEGYELRPDLLAAATAMVTDTRSDPFVIAIGSVVSETETVLRMLEGRHQREMGLLVLTSARVFFRANKTAGRLEFNLRLPAIAQIEAITERAAGTVRIRSMDAVHVVDQILGTQGDTLVETVRAATDGRPTPGRDPMALLAELRALRDAGAISLEEFEIRKAALWSEL